MNTIGGDRKKRAGASSKSMTVGGTFKNASAAANISVSSKALSEEVATAIIGSVVSFMSPSQGAGPFYSQVRYILSQYDARNITLSWQC